jgi:hypothetical protein
MAGRSGLSHAGFPSTGLALLVVCFIAAREERPGIRPREIPSSPACRACTRFGAAE